MGDAVSREQPAGRPAEVEVHVPSDQGSARHSRANVHVRQEWQRHGMHSGTTVAEMCGVRPDSNVLEKVVFFYSRKKTTIAETDEARATAAGGGAAGVAGKGAALGSPQLAQITGQPVVAVSERAHGLKFSSTCPSRKRPRTATGGRCLGFPCTGISGGVPRTQPRRRFAQGTQLMRCISHRNTCSRSNGKKRQK